MSKKSPNNYAFIDSQNLNLSVRRLGWKLDLIKFRRYLTEKYSVTKAFIFIGFVEGNSELYRHLQEDDYILIFKPTLQHKDGTTKGNVDAELVMHAMIELNNFDRAVIVSGDGDFFCLVDQLLKLHKLEKLIIPDQKRYSALLKRIDSGYLAFISDLQKKLVLTAKRKEPRADQPAKGALRRDSTKNVAQESNSVKS
jgi:uncharacterized LabA/DUF88 family protein